MLHSYIRDITHSCTCDMTHSYIRDTPLGKGDGSLQVGQTDTAFKAHVIGPLLVYEACHTWNCVAVCCSVLQCVAVCCSVLQCVAVCCSVLQCRRVHAACYTWNYVAVCCSVLQCVAVSQSACGVLHMELCCSALQCVSVCCNVNHCRYDRQTRHSRHMPLDLSTSWS